MGQYYKTVIIREGGEGNKDIITVDNDCKFKEYHGLKLMEHSYLNNEWTDAIAHFIYRNKVRMAHVGDYAYEYPQYQLAYNENVKTEPLDISDNYDSEGKIIEFDYSNKFLINWDKKEYINFNHWKLNNKVSWDEDTYICPMTMLTALGNDRGGGDYHSPLPHAEDVGCWAWDCISIEDQVPEGYIEEGTIYFKE